MATREELILDVCSSIGEAKEKCVASVPTNEDEGHVLNESAIEQHFDVQDESLNSDHPDMMTDRMLLKLRGVSMGLR